MNRLLKLKKHFFAVSLLIFIVSCNGKSGDSSDSEKDDSAEPNSPQTPKKVLDVSQPADRALLGKSFQINFKISSAKTLAGMSAADIVTFAHPLQKNNPTFAQQHGIPTQNFKTRNTLDVQFSVTSRAESGQFYTLKNYDIFYEDFKNTSTPLNLASAKIENKIENVKLWKRQSGVTFSSAFFSQNTGKMMDRANGRPLIFYVKIDNQLSNGMQILNLPRTNPYLTVNTGDCSRIENSDQVELEGFLQRTCVEAHGYKIPILIEDKDKERSADKIPHIRKIFKFYLDFFPKEITETIAENQATLALFYDDDWTDRQEEDHNNSAEKHLVFQDLSAAESMPHLPKGERDASFEEILHLVHDYGIMANAVKNPSSKWAGFQKELEALMTQAIQNGAFYPNQKDPAGDAELDAESYDQEYLAYSLQAYYDFNYKGYVAPELNSGNYDELKNNDPDMVKFMEKYFPKRQDAKRLFPGYPLDGKDD